MKTKLYVFLSMVLLLSGCEHPDLNRHRAHPNGGSIVFFQFTDTTLMQKVMVQRGYDLMLEGNYAYDCDKPYFIPLYPRNTEDYPLFGEDRFQIQFYGRFEFISGDFYSIEDLVDSPKFIALNDGYYICYPFTQLESNALYVNIDWKDLLSADIDQAEIYTLTPYKKRYAIYERDLVKLTKKSTLHFKRLNKEMITIEDVVEVLNMLIDNNTIEDYCRDVL